MAKHIITGKNGEDHAVKYLIDIGYEILERNWRFSKAEIDIIAKINDIIIFVEVKTRSSSFFGNPEEFVSLYQEKMIADAASRYLEKINHDWEFRFDVIGIILKKEEVKELRHFKDAFFPGIE